VGIRAPIVLGDEALTQRLENFSTNHSVACYNGDRNERRALVFAREKAKALEAAAANVLSSTVQVIALGQEIE